MRRSRGLQGVDAEVLDRYQQALLALPHDGNLQGVEALMAKQRLLACQPSSSPFALVKRLKVAMP
jgi:hypothetical protein